LYLPPYSPDFNLIKEFFLVLKVWLKRYFELAKGIPFTAYLEEAVIAYSGGKHAKGYFKHAGIYIGEYICELEERFQDDYDSEV